VHILRLIINPDPDKAQNIKNINIKKLEELTNEAMSNWWNEKDNLLKRPFLKEIFKVAKQEERYRNGELGMISFGLYTIPFTNPFHFTPDGDALIVIMHGDERSGMGISDDEPDDGLRYDEDEDGNPDLTPTSSMPTPPENHVSPQLTHLQSGFQSRQAEIDPSGYGCMRELPVRSYPTSQMDDQLAYTDTNQHSLSSQPNYNTDRGSAGFQNQNLGTQDHNRRPPWSANGFPGVSPVFGSWASNSNNMMHNNPLQYNAFSSPLPHPTPQATTYQLPLPSSANQQPLPPMHHQAQAFNDQNLVGRSYEPISPNGTLRSNTLHPHLIPQQPNSFQEYLHDNSNYGQGDAEMKDEHIRGQ
jgi:hypothetical protein